MRLIWHLCRKDFLHLRGRWAFLVGVLLLRTLLGFWLLRAPALPADPLRIAGNVLILLLVAELALTLLLAALSVQEDLPLGGQPLWRTRPIAGARLLASKGLSLALMLGLPSVVLAAPLWLACGASLSDLAWASAGQLISRFLVVLLGAALAVITGNLIRFVTGALICLLALPIAFAGFLTGDVPFSPGGRTGGLLSYVVVLLALVPLAAATYVERRRSRLIAVGGASVLIAVGALLWIYRAHPVLFSGGVTDSAGELNPQAAAGLQLEFDSMRGRFGGAVGSGTPEIQAVAVRLQGRPEGVGVHLRPRRQELSWMDGTVSVRPSFPQWSTSALPDRQIGPALGLGRPDGDVATVRPDRLVFSFDPGADAVERLRGLPATYRLLADVVLFRPEVEVVALSELRRWRVHGGRGLRLLAVTKRGKGSTGVELLATEFITPVSDVWQALMHRPGDGSDRLAGVSFVNRRTGTGTAALSREEGMVPIAGVRFFRLNLIGDLARIGGEGDGVDLVWLRWRRISTVTREVVAPEVRLAFPEAERPVPGGRTSP